MPLPDLFPDDLEHTINAIDFFVDWLELPTPGVAKPTYKLAGLHRTRDALDRLLCKPDVAERTTYLNETLTRDEIGPWNDD